MNRSWRTSLFAFGTALVVTAAFACSDDPDAQHVQPQPDAATSDTDAASPAEQDSGKAETSTPSSPDGGYRGTPVSPADALKAAALLGSCIPDDRSNRILERLYSRVPVEMYEVWERKSIACLASKTNGCAGVEACTGVKMSIDAACVDGCSGTKLTACDDSLRGDIDCNKLGLQCVQNGTRFSCETGALPACSVDTYVASCTAAGRVSYCSAMGVKLGPTCADYGTTCGTTTTGSFQSVGCKGPGAACEATSTSWSGIDLRSGTSCAGNTLKACVNGGTLDVACDSLATGFTCQTAGGKSYCGLGTACTPGTGRPTCNGTKLVVCNGGRTDEIDCTSLGFTGCDNALGMCTPNIVEP